MDLLGVGPSPSHLGDGGRMGRWPRPPRAVRVPDALDQPGASLPRLFLLRATPGHHLHPPERGQSWEVTWFTSPVNRGTWPRPDRAVAIGRSDVNGRDDDLVPPTPAGALPRARAPRARTRRGGDDLRPRAGSAGPALVEARALTLARRRFPRPRGRRRGGAVRVITPSSSGIEPPPGPGRRGRARENGPTGSSGWLYGVGKRPPSRMAEAGAPSVSGSRS